MLMFVPGKAGMPPTMWIVWSEPPLEAEIFRSSSF